MLLKEYFMLNLIKNQNKFSFLKKHMILNKFLKQKTCPKFVWHFKEN